MLIATSSDRLSVDILSFSEREGRSKFSTLQQLIDRSLQESTAFTRAIMPKTMTAEEVVSFINAGKSAIVATVRKNGSPHTAWTPIAYVEHRLYTYGDPKSVFYKNVKRDGRIAISITSDGSAVFIEGNAKEITPVSEAINGLLSSIRSVVKNWIPDSSYNYSSLEECQASILEVEISRILSYKESNREVIGSYD